LVKDLAITLVDLATASFRLGPGEQKVLAKITDEMGAALQAWQLRGKEAPRRVEKTFMFTDIERSTTWSPSPTPACIAHRRMPDGRRIRKHPTHGTGSDGAS